MRWHDDYSFWLVQRFEPHWRGKQELICDYMGSAEFEFGAVPKAVQLMQAQELVDIEHPITYKGETKTVYFLGAAADIERKVAAMQQWVDAGMDGKEMAHFDVAFTGLDWRGKPASDYYRTKVWLAINPHTLLAWALEREWLDVFVNQSDVQATPFGVL